MTKLTAPERVASCVAAGVFALLALALTWLEAFDWDAADRQAHRAGVLACLEAIRAGEVYQACVCTQFAGTFTGEPLDFFIDGVARTAPARAAYVAGPWGAVASLSPELFLCRRGDLVKILWHDGLGMSLYAKRLDRGKFIWPSASDGAVSISLAQMAYMLEGIDWRHPQRTFHPQAAGGRVLGDKGTWLAAEIFF